MSKTIIYVVISLLNQLLQWAGVSIGSDQVDTFVTVLLGIVTALGIAYERYKRGDINIFGVRS